MPMTATEKLLARKSGPKCVHPGEIIAVSLDMVLGNDITAPGAIAEFRRTGRARVFDRQKIALVLDHFVPNKDIKSAEQSKVVRDFAREQDITHFYDVGEMGIEHVILPEKGLVGPGMAVIGADSHTCTYGAVNAFATGVGSTDMAAAMATGQTWFKVPPTIKVTLSGGLPRWVSGKDVILSIIGRIGVDGARYKALEFHGGGVAALSMDDRFTIANMVVEAGAKNGIFPCDATLRQYLAGRFAAEYEPVWADDGALYESELTVNLEELEPLVALPHLPENVRPVREVNIPVDQVVIGSCTNGRLSDLAAAAAVMAGKRVARGVRVIVIPGSQEVYREALSRGYLATFVDAGAAVSTPTCGPCLGGYMGILAGGEKALATTNRNFVGRMGAATSEVYLASPVVAAATAVTGRITHPGEVM